MWIRSTITYFRIMKVFQNNYSPQSSKIRYKYIRVRNSIRTTNNYFEMKIFLFSLVILTIFYIGSAEESDSMEDAGKDVLEELERRCGGKGKFHFRCTFQFPKTLS